MLASTLKGAIALAGLGAYLALSLRTQWRIGDEGAIVYGAQRVAQGAIPYRDFFEGLGPGTFYWTALWFTLLGINWLVSRLVVLITALGSAWAISLLTTRVYRGRLAMLPAFLYSIVSVPLWPGANHHFESNLFALLALAAAGSRHRFGRAAMMSAGVLAAISATIMPQKGTLVVAALLGSALLDGVRTRGWIRALKDAAWMVVPFCGVGLLVLAFFWWHGAFADFLYANVIWPSTRYYGVNVVPYAFGLHELYFASWLVGLDAAFGRPIALLVTLVLVLPLLFIVAVPFLATVMALRSLAAERRGVAGAPALPSSYWLVGLALLVSEYHRWDIMHLVYRLSCTPGRCHRFADAADEYVRDCCSPDAHYQLGGPGALSCIARSRTWRDRRNATGTRAIART